MEKKKTDKKTDNTVKTPQNGNFIRCINIDCVFNSSNEHGAIRNTCSHPNVVVESRFADITIAICSEFRSKKDYSFEKPATVTELKTGEKTEIKGKPELGVETIEKVTTKELEENLVKSPENKPSDENKNTDDNKTVINSQDYIKPLIVESHPVQPDELTPDEIYNLSTKPGTDFLILKKLYQPNTKKGLIGSVIVHMFFLLLMYQFLVPKEEKHNGENNQRIVIVEDLEMPKFDPPDIDKINEEERKLKEEQDIKDNTKEVRPKIEKKTIKPKINRPTDNSQKDTNKLVTNDTNKSQGDTSITKTMRDTTRIMVPDSLKSTYDQNEIGLKMWFPAGWKLLDNRAINLNQKEFNGVIIATDTGTADPGAVNMFVLIDDPKHSAYNKATYKNPFQMDDSLIAAYVTDPIKSSGKKFSAKYFLFTDPTGLKNIQVNVDYASQPLMEKYQPMVDAVVRSIKIAPPPENKNP